MQPCKQWPSGVPTPGKEATSGGAAKAVMLAFPGCITFPHCRICPETLCCALKCLCTACRTAGMLNAVSAAAYYDSLGHALMQGDLQGHMQAPWTFCWGCKRRGGLQWGPGQAHSGDDLYYMGPPLQHHCHAVHPVSSPGSHVLEMAVILADC